MFYFLYLYFSLEKNAKWFVRNALSNMQYKMILPSGKESWSLHEEFSFVNGTEPLSIYLSAVRSQFISMIAAYYWV